MSYNCDLCEKTFKQKGNYKRHLTSKNHKQIIANIDLIKEEIIEEEKTNIDKTQKIEEIIEFVNKIDEEEEEVEEEPEEVEEEIKEESNEKIEKELGSIGKLLTAFQSNLGMNTTKKNTEKCEEIEVNILKTELLKKETELKEKQFKLLKPQQATSMTREKLILQILELEDNNVKVKKIDSDKYNILSKLNTEELITKYAMLKYYADNPTIDGDTLNIFTTGVGYITSMFFGWNTKKNDKFNNLFYEKIDKDIILKKELGKHLNNNVMASKNPFAIGVRGIMYYAGSILKMKGINYTMVKPKITESLPKRKFVEDIEEPVEIDVYESEDESEEELEEELEEEIIPGKRIITREDMINARKNRGNRTKFE